MNGREPIQQIVDDRTSEPSLIEELELAVEIREYASSRLGLPQNESYTEYVHTGRDAVTWNVIATEEFSLQPKRWCFLVAGCVPYRGYFVQRDAEKFADTLRGRSFDVIVSPAIAYSTLGWFDDPLLDTMLQYREEQLAGVIFHELAHQQLYVKNDTRFNESYAGFVEEVGVETWLSESGREDLLDRWRAVSQASLQFNDLLIENRKRLQTIFDSGENEEVMRIKKKTIFAEITVQYDRLVKDEWDGQNMFKSWFDRDLNNARLALADSYQGGLCAFKNLYEMAGRDIVQFQRMAAQKASLNQEQRTAWLSQSCEANLAGR